MEPSPKTLAIDVVLLPPEEVMERCRKVNAFLWNSAQTGFLFDETHLPHLSLLQQFSPSESLDDVYDIIHRITLGRGPIGLRATGITHIALPDGIPFNGFDFSAPDAFFELQRVLIAELAQFATDGDGNAFYADPGERIRDGSILWTRNFRKKKDHRPHISLGVGPEPAFSGPFAFTASRLAVCHLGNFNTCRSILKEWQL